MEVSKSWGYHHQIIHFGRIFHDINHLSWGTTMTMGKRPYTTGKRLALKCFGRWDLASRRRRFAAGRRSFSERGPRNIRLTHEKSGRYFCLGGLYDIIIIYTFIYYITRIIYIYTYVCIYTILYIYIYIYIYTHIHNVRLASSEIHQGTPVLSQSHRGFGHLHR